MKNSLKITEYQNEDLWLEARQGRIGGTRLKDIIVKRGTKPKKGFYEIIAERVAIPAGTENKMDRGHTLEVDALIRFEKETWKKVNKSLVIWSRTDNEDIYVSPDGYIEQKRGKKIKEACEVKCLNSASHIEAYLTQQIPSDYEAQVLQYFIANDDLEKLYFIMFDPRLPRIDFFYFTVTRKEKEGEIQEYLQLERDTLVKIAEIEKMLTF
jgi:hypothetical protein